MTAILAARTPAEQRAAFERIIAPLFDSQVDPLPVANRRCRFTRWAFRRRNMTSWSRPRTAIRSRCCANAWNGWPATFPIRENYFAWQAFGRGYDVENREAVPAYLREDIYEVIRTRTDQVEVHHASLTDFLKEQPAQSLHRYVLLDAQDWMNAATARRAVGARSTAPRMRAMPA